MPQISICIPVLNNKYYTLNCINHLLKLDQNKFQIIIVDNASVDGTQEELQNIKSIKYIRNEKNMGFGFACNQCYQSSSSPFVLFLNNDVKFQIGYIEWFNNLLNKLQFNPNTIFSPTGGLIDADCNFKYETNDPNKKFNYLSGWNLASSKEVLNKLIEDNNFGPFNSQLYFCYFEDTHLSFLAREKNIELELFPSPLVHIGKQTSKKLNINELYNKSKKQFIKIWKNKI